MALTPGPTCLFSSPYREMFHIKSCYSKLRASAELLSQLNFAEISLSDNITSKEKITHFDKYFLNIQYQIKFMLVVRCQKWQARMNRSFPGLGPCTVVPQSA